MNDYIYPFKKKSMLLVPKYDTKNDIDHVMYQVVLAYIENTDIMKGLTTSDNYYKHMVCEGKPIPKKMKISKTLSKSRYILKFKTCYLIKRLFYSNNKVFEEERRKNGKYYRDKISQNKEIELPIIHVTPKHDNHTEVMVYEGNHRVVAFNDLGFDTVVVMTLFKHHEAFVYYKDYPFVDRW